MDVHNMWPEEIQIVSSKEYLDWLYNYLQTNYRADDESAIYTYEGIDKECGSLLWAFGEYVRDLALERDIPITIDYNDCFDNQCVIVKIKDMFFEVYTMWGQGSWTCVTMLDEVPKDKYVKL